ncbi:MAG: hypothetical protein ACM3N9_05455, partial [Syntrophothermus sp.]
MLKLLLPLFFIFFVTTHAQWIPANGPYGKVPVKYLVVNDSLILVSTGCGYFFTYAPGQDWQPGYPRTFTCATKIGNELFAGGYGLFKIDLAHPDSPPAEISEIDPVALVHNDTSLFAASKSAGFFSCKFNGQSVAGYNNGLPADTMPMPGGYFVEFPLRCLEIQNNYLFCGTSRGLYGMSLPFSSWTLLSQGLPAEEIRIIRSFGNDLFAATASDLYLSTNQGNH